MMTDTYCLNCQHWRRLDADRSVGVCAACAGKPTQSYRFQFEGEDCQAYAFCGVKREPHRDTALAARDKRYAYYIPAGGV